MLSAAGGRATLGSAELSVKRQPYLERLVVSKHAGGGDSLMSN